MMIEHSYSASCTLNCAQAMQQLSEEIKGLEKELNNLKIQIRKPKPMSINDIKENDEKVLLSVWL
jgi:hypothetical protein